MKCATPTRSCSKSPASWPLWSPAKLRFAIIFLGASLPTPNAGSARPIVPESIFRWREAWRPPPAPASSQWPRIEQLVSAVLQEAAFIHALRVEQGFDPARARLRASPSFELILDLRRSISNLITAENQRLLKLDQQAHADATATRRSLVIGFVLNVGLLASAFWLIRDDFRLRREQAASLAQMNEKLERKVFERTAEIAKSNAALEVENLERQWAFASLERFQRHNELIINSIVEAVVVISATGVVLRINQAAQHWTGFTHEQWIGRRLATILRPAANQAAPVDWSSHPVAQALRKGQATTLQGMVLICQDRPDAVCSLRLQPIHDGGKVVAGILCFNLASTASEKGPNPAPA